MMDSQKSLQEIHVDLNRAIQWLVYECVQSESNLEASMPKFMPALIIRVHRVSLTCALW